MMLDEKQFLAFKYEIENWNNIPITSKLCGVGCLFCKLSGDPLLKRFPPIPAITTEELYDGFKYIDKEYKYVRLGAGVMVATKTDPFLHPQIYDFIKDTSLYFPNNIITTVTTASYIDLNKIDFLNSINNYRIDLSLITLQEQREILMRLSTRDKIMQILKNAPLNKISLMFDGDLETLKRDLDLLIKLDVVEKSNEILVRRIEHTKYSPNKLKQISMKSIIKFAECAKMLKCEYPFVKFTVPVLDNVYEEGTVSYIKRAKIILNKIIHAIENNCDKNFLLLSPVSTYSFFEQSLSQYSNIKIQQIRSLTYGGSITVAGLMTNEDILLQVKNIEKINFIILPKVMYDKTYLDIAGNAMHELEEYFNVKILCY